MSEERPRIVLPLATFGLILRVCAAILLTLWLFRLLTGAIPWNWIAIDLWLIGALLG